jgi:hypothetical protein
LKNHFNQIKFSWMFNIFFQNFFIIWGGKIKKLKIATFLKKKNLVWKTAKVVVGYILLKANIPIIYLSCKWCPQPPPKEKKGFGFWALVCVKKIKHTHTHNLDTQVVEKKSAFLHSIHLMGRSGQNGLWYITL